MRLRVQYNPDRNEYIIQEKCFFVWCNRGVFWDTGGYSQFTEFYKTEAEAKLAVIRALEIKIKNEKTKEQRKQYGAGYQPIEVSTEDLKKKYPEYLL